MNCSDVRSVYWDLPFFGLKEARYRLEPFRDNVRFLGCDCRLFWELFLASWDSFSESQLATCWDVFFHQPRFTLGFCDSHSKLLFGSRRTGRVLKNIRIVDCNLLVTKLLVKYLVVPKVLGSDPTPSDKSLSLDSTRSFFALKLSLAKNVLFVKTD